MKRFWIFGIVLVVACAATAFISYSIGYQKRADMERTLRSADSFITLGILKELRAGHVEEATHEVETICFRDSSRVYGDPKFQSRFRGVTNAAFSAEIRNYLATYHTNRSDWTPAMLRLESGLRNWP